MNITVFQRQLNVGFIIRRRIIRLRPGQFNSGRAIGGRNNLAVFAENLLIIAVTHRHFNFAFRQIKILVARLEIHQNVKTVSPAMVIPAGVIIPAIYSSLFPPRTGTAGAFVVISLPHTRVASFLPVLPHQLGVPM